MTKELSIDLVLDAPKEKIFRCWTDAELLKQWFAPKPWTTPSVEIDLRVGGGNKFTMRSPEGQDFPNEGVYLAIEPNKRLIFTDAFTAGWRPTDKPFFVGEIELSDAGEGKTRYVARARHWTEDACAEHAKMGFVEGWTQCARQLEEVAKGL